MVCPTSWSQCLVEKDEIFDQAQDCLDSCGILDADASVDYQNDYRECYTTLACRTLQIIHIQ